MKRMNELLKEGFKITFSEGCGSYICNFGTHNCYDDYGGNGKTIEEAFENAFKNLYKEFAEKTRKSEHEVNKQKRIMTTIQKVNQEQNLGCIPERESDPRD